MGTWTQRDDKGGVLRTVTGTTYKLFGVAKDVKGRWQIDHTLSGARVTTLADRRDALALARALRDEAKANPDVWNFALKPDDEHMSRVRASYGRAMAAAFEKGSTMKGEAT